MSRITAEAETILTRVIRMSRLIPNVERHLLDDQADAVAPGAAADTGSRSGIANPTPALVAALAPFAHAERQLLGALRHVDRALDDAERLAASVIADRHHTDETPRCPGWNAELRSRLGGCGKPLEHWTDANGVQHNRATLLCISCRKAEERETTRGVSHDETPR